MKRLARAAAFGVPMAATIVFATALTSGAEADSKPPWVPQTTTQPIIQPASPLIIPGLGQSSLPTLSPTPTPVIQKPVQAVPVAPRRVVPVKRQ